MNHIRTGTNMKGLSNDVNEQVSPVDIIRIFSY